VTAAVIVKDVSPFGRDSTADADVFRLGVVINRIALSSVDDRGGNVSYASSCIGVHVFHLQFSDRILAF